MGSPEQLPGSNDSIRYGASVERREADITDTIPWAGGIFEVAGGFDFNFQTTVRGVNRYEYCWPRLSFGDGEEGKLRKLQGAFGGTVGRTAGGSWKWTMKGSSVPEMLELIAQYIPSRESTITAVLLWEDAQTEERLEIGRLYSRERPVDSVEVETYRELLRDPRFAAGVLDGRGATHVEGKELHITSRNRALLEKLSLAG